MAPTDKPALARAQGSQGTSALHPALLSPRQSTGPGMPAGPKRGGLRTHPVLWGQARSPWAAEKGVVARWVGGLGCRYPRVTRSGEQGLTLVSEDWGHESGRQWRGGWVWRCCSCWYPGVRSLHCPWCCPLSCLSALQSFHGSTTPPLEGLWKAGQYPRFSVTCTNSGLGGKSLQSQILNI